MHLDKLFSDPPSTYSAMIVVTKVAKWGKKQNKKKMKLQHKK